LLFNYLKVLNFGCTYNLPVDSTPRVATKISNERLVVKQVPKFATQPHSSIRSDGSSKAPNRKLNSDSDDE
jgi:hypothetical protein